MSEIKDRIATGAAVGVAIISLLILYRPWLLDRTLFFDEWMYLEELADAGSWIKWVLTPMQEHFTPVAKAIFVLDNAWFGYHGGAFTAVSLVLHAVFILAICWFLRAASIEWGVVLVAALLLACTAAYPEVVIWSHDKLVLFFIGLFGALALFVSAERRRASRGAHVSLAALVGVCGCLLLSMLSLGAGLFTMVFFAGFALAYDRRAVLRPHYLVVAVVAAVVFLAMYAAFALHGVSADFQARVEDPWTLQALLGTVRTGLFSFVFGSVLPLFHIHTRPTEAWFASLGTTVLLGLAVFTAAFLTFLLTRQADRIARTDGASGRARSSLFLLGAGVAAVTSMSQAFYRAKGTYAGLEFLLDWNRYAFLPGIGIVLWLTAICDALTRVFPSRWRYAAAALVAGAIAASFPSAVSEVNTYQAFFFRNARVKEIQAAFEPLFQPTTSASMNDLVLPDIVIDEPIFVRPLRLSTYARYHRPALSASTRFFLPAQFDQLAPERRQAIRDFILRNARSRVRVRERIDRRQRDAGSPRSGTG